MTIRIRVQLGPGFEQSLARQRECASILAAFLTPAAVIALLLGIWRLGWDLRWAGEFAISRGLLSHWQVWFAIAGLLQICAVILNHFGRGYREDGEEYISPLSPLQESRASRKHA